MSKKPKKLSDLWDTFRSGLQNYTEKYGSALGFALFGTYWAGYVTALCEFGFMKEKDRQECLDWLGLR